jgi:hypothetical protein
MPPVPDDNSFVQGRVIMRDGIRMVLKGEVVDNFDEIIELVSKESDFEAVSPEKIEDEYSQSITNLLNLYGRSPSDKQVKNEMDSYLKRLLESIEERRVLIPIESFRLIDIQELTIGKVRFIEFGKIQEQLKSDYHKLIDKNPVIPLDQKPLNKEHFEEIFVKNLLNKMCADIIVKAEKEKSYFKALQEIENAINLLRCYIPLIFSSGLRVKIGIDGSIIKRTHVSYLSIETVGGQFNGKGLAIGPLNEYELNPASLKHLKDNGHLDQFGAILYKDKSSRTELENRIVTAIRWIGSGINEEANCDKFLKLAIALECLLLTREEEGKRAPIAERCAYLLTRDPQKQLDIDKRVKKLYDKRSKIAHEGETEIEKEQLAYMKRIVLSCLLEICPKTSEWKSIQDIVNWSQEQKYHLLSNND